MHSFNKIVVYVNERNKCYFLVSIIVTHSIIEMFKYSNLILFAGLLILLTAV
jgi:hypothetical protein